MRIVFDDGVCQEVEAEAEGAERFRLLETPLFSETTARYGDLVELREDDSVWRFVAILERSPLVTFERLISRDVVESDAWSALTTDVRGVGGQWEQAFGGIIFLHVPAERAEWLEARLRDLASS